MIETMTFAEWLAEGHIDVSGTIKHVNGPCAYGLISPDGYSAEFLYFSFKAWPVSRRQQRINGRRVRFDVPVQEASEDRHANAYNVHFLEDSAKAG